MGPTTEKRRKRCKLCGETGHNKLACPLHNASLSAPSLCSQCGLPDHTSRSCPDKRRPSKVTCSLCGQDSHNCRTCPLNPKRKEKRPRRASAATDKGEGSAPLRRSAPRTVPRDPAAAQSGILPHRSAPPSDQRATSIVRRPSTSRAAPSKGAPHAAQPLQTRGAANAAIPLTAGGSGLLDRRFSNVRGLPATETAFAVPLTSVKLGTCTSALPETVEDVIQLAAAASHRCAVACLCPSAKCTYAAALLCACCDARLSATCNTMLEQALALCCTSPPC